MKVFGLMLFLCVSLVASTGWLYRGMISVHRSAVLAHARGIADVIAQSRQTYAELRSECDPLPITFARELGKRIATARVDIYSPYPFPSNNNGGLHDRFQREAWDRLANHHDPEFVSWELSVLRYAVPDYMGASCVSCHNSAPNTPKADWKVGDIRGVIEVSLSY